MAKLKVLLMDVRCKRGIGVIPTKRMLFTFFCILRRGLAGGR